MNTSIQNLVNDKTTDNTSSENLIDNIGKQLPKSPSKKKRKNKQTRSISNIPNFLQNSSKAMRDFIRDSLRDEDRDNMNLLLEQMKEARRDENSKKGGYRFNGKNTRIIKKKDIRIQHKRGIGAALVQSKRKILPTYKHV